jgi:hypothetical protein
MSCCTKSTVIEVAVRTLIKELVATYEARRNKRRSAKQCQPCETPEQEAQP